MTLQTVVATVFIAVQRPAGPGGGISTPWFASRLDCLLPLMPWTVWLYLSWYVAPAMILLADRRSFRVYASAVLFSFLCCTAGWLLLPASIDRPTLDASAGLSISALRVVYRFDSPCNLFPSFHAALAAVVFLLPHGSGLARAVVCGWMLAICVSCVLTKQHYVFDVLSGILVGWFAVASAGRCAEWVDGLRAAAWRVPVSPSLSKDRS